MPEHPCKFLSAVFRTTQKVESILTGLISAAFTENQAKIDKDSKEISSSPLWLSQKLMFSSLFPVDLPG